MDILSNFEQEVHEIYDKEVDKLVGCDKAIQHCKKTLAHLRKYLVQNQDISIEEEIHFFKCTKQIPQTKLFYFTMVQSYFLSLPSSSLKNQRYYIIEAEKRIRKFLSKHDKFVTYYKLNQVHLDPYFFVRNNTNNTALTSMSIVTILDSEFYTSKDILLSHVSATFKFQQFLRNEIKTNSTNKLSNHTKLSWEGSKVDFVELVYGLYHSRVFNSNVSVKTISEVLSTCFQLEINDLYNTYSDIKRRKKVQLQFIETMKIRLQKELNEDLLH